MSTRTYGPTATKIGHGLAKGLGIKLNYRNETGQGERANKLARGESVFSVESAPEYIEYEPSSLDFIEEWAPGGKDFGNYFISLFPFLKWLPRYNASWLVGDVIAGCTIGSVVVPQSLAYAQLATLPVEFGLYSAFMGVLVYWIFGTSKDISIGPVAVMSTVTGNVVTQVLAQPNMAQYADTPWVIASALAVIAGAILAFLGFARLGFIVDFISLPAVSAFITGSAFYIGVGQIPSLLGISKKYVNNRDSGYLIVINTLKHLDKTKLDAAIGLSALVLLYTIKYGLIYAQKRLPKYRKTIFFALCLRTIFVILLYTMIGYVCNHGKSKKAWLFKLTGSVPRGFTHAGAPTINTAMISAFASQLPATVIVLLIEHISISKSFGRVNNYVINPSQELLGIGVTNLLGPLVGAYPATGSFSRTAINSKAGVRSPLGGLFTAIVVLIALYALVSAFYYIPKAALSAVIIHAVFDLITPANTVYQFWRISPLEVPIFIIGVITTVFSTIEDGVYVVVATSAALLLFRMAKAQGRFMGAAKVYSVVGDDVIGGLENKEQPNNDGPLRAAIAGGRPTDGNGSLIARTVYLPIDHHNGTNPEIQVKSPYPGIFIYRFSEGFNYPNAGHYLDAMVQYVMAETRRTDTFVYSKPGDRPWNNPAPRKGVVEFDENKPTLKAIVMDFSSVNFVDVTSVQYLIDVRNQLDRWASPDTVEWHLACINQRWTKRALAAGGFGYPTPRDVSGELHRWKPVYSVAEMGGDQSAATAAEEEENRRRRTLGDIEANDEDNIGADAGKKETGSKAYEAELNTTSLYAQRKGGQIAVVQGLNRPNFHIDLTSAIHAAISNVESKEAGQRAAGPRGSVGKGKPVTATLEGGAATPSSSEN